MRTIRNLVVAAALVAFAVLATPKAEAQGYPTCNFVWHYCGDILPGFAALGECTCLFATQTYICEFTCFIYGQDPVNGFCEGGWCASPCVPWEPCDA